MNTYYFNDDSFKNTKLYQDFIKSNSGLGKLKIRAYSASEAIPLESVFIRVSKVIDNNLVIFYEGSTDNSGVIEKILLPAPVNDSINTDVPLKTTYEINAKYQDVFKNYQVYIYDLICVVQDINILPFTMGDSNGY